MRADWHEAIGELIRQDVNESIQHWREQAYIRLTDFDEDEPVMIELRIPEYDDGFLDPDVVLPRRSLADLFREEIQLMGLHSDEATDEELLAHTVPSYHITGQRKLKFFQDLLRLLLAYEQARWDDDG